MNFIGQPLIRELRAKLRGPSVLPDDGVVHGLSRFAIPDDRRFPLIRDTDPCDFMRWTTGLLNGGTSDFQLRSRNGRGIVLNEAGLRENLRKLFPGCGDSSARLIKENRSGAGGALIEGKDKRHILIV